MSLQISLPQGPSVFIGRKKILENLKKDFLRFNILIIEGVAGIGKTTLSIYLANLINENNNFRNFNNRVIWLQCEEDWNVETFLYELNSQLKDLGEFEFDEYLRNKEVDFQGKVRNLISILNNKSYAIFIDDYHRITSDNSQIMIKMFNKFIKNSRIILISREKPAFSPMEWLEIFEVNVPYLNKEETFLMIKNLMELHSDSEIKENISEQIYLRLGGHPFLIKAFISLLLTGDKTGEELLKELSDFSNISEEYILNQILKDLSKPEKELLLSFSYYRKPIKKEGLEIIYPEKNIDKILNTLRKKFLLELSGDKRYFLQAPLREYFYSKSANKSLHRICASYYTKQLKNKDEVNLEYGKEAFYHLIQSEEYETACKILESMLNKMMAYFQIEEMEKRIDFLIKKTDKIGHSIFIVKSELLRIQGKSREAISILENNQGKSHREKNQTLIHLARLFSKLGKWDRALELIKKSISMSDKIEDKFFIAKGFSFIGSIYRLKGDFRRAIDYYEKSEDLNKNPKSKELKLSIIQSKAIIFSKEGKLKEAMDAFKLCLKEAEEMNWIGMILSLNNNLALVYYESGDFIKALKLWEDNIDLSRKFGWKEALMHSLVSSSLLYEEQGEPQRAISHYREALHISISIEDNYLQSIILIRLGGLIISQGDIEEGEKYINRALDKLSEYDFPDLLNDINLILSEINFIKNNIKITSELVNKVLNSGNTFQIVKALRFKYILESDIGFREKSEVKIKTLYGSKKRRAEKYFSHIDELASKISPESSSRKYIVKMAYRQYDATLEEINRLRNRKEEFDIFIDTIKGTVYEKAKGEIEIASKKSIAELLFFMVKNCGKFFSSKDLFSSIWNARYVPENDGTTVKMSISRLRKLIESDPKNPKYIKLSPIRYKEERKYYFDDDRKFCYIEKMTDKL